MALNPDRTVNILVLLCIVLIALAMFWLDSKFERMKKDCEIMGGKFYSISFTENICVEGERVRQLQ